MNRPAPLFTHCLTLLCGLGFFGGLEPGAAAGGLFRRRAPTPAPAPTAYVVPQTRPAKLGTFEPTPYIVVRGNAPTGGGYSPLGQYGNSSMDLYGPISSFRSTAAPVLTYTRGYDGRTAIVEGTSFSTPLLPPLSPVVYPTQATYYYGFRNTTTPPWWTNANTWIDQN